MSGRCRRDRRPRPHADCRRRPARAASPATRSRSYDLDRAHVLLDPASRQDARAHHARSDADGTSGSPHRSASQRAAMRVPLPDISASEPSGFQITISASSRPRRRPRGSRPPPPTLASRPARASAARRAQLARPAGTRCPPRASARTHRPPLGRAVGLDGSEARDPAHPLPLVGREAAACGRPARLRLGRRQRRRPRRARGSSAPSRESRLSRARRTSSTTPASNIARVRSSIRRSSSSTRDVEADDEGRVPRVGRPTAVRRGGASGRRRRARARGRRGGGRSGARAAAAAGSRSREQRVRRLGALVVVDGGSQRSRAPARAPGERSSSASAARK